MITIKDMSGLIPPKRVAGLIRLFKHNLKVPVDFHTHCTPGYGLASVLSAIVSGADIVDTNIWYFGRSRRSGHRADLHLLSEDGCRAGYQHGSRSEDQQPVAAHSQGLEQFNAVKQFPNPFNPLTDTLPAEVDKSSTVRLRRPAT